MCWRYAWWFRPETDRPHANGRTKISDLGISVRVGVNDVKISSFIFAVARWTVDGGDAIMNDDARAERRNGAESIQTALTHAKIDWLFSSLGTDFTPVVEAPVLRRSRGSPICGPRPRTGDGRLGRGSLRTERCRCRTRG